MKKYFIHSKLFKEKNLRANSAVANKFPANEMGLIPHFNIAYSPGRNIWQNSRIHVKSDKSSISSF